MRKSNVNPMRNNNNIFYDEYISHDRIVNGLNKGEIFVGCLKVIATKRRIAYVISENISVDIFVNEDDRNRAIHGDIVAVCLFPESEWVPIIKKTTAVDSIDSNSVEVNDDLEVDRGIEDRIINDNGNDINILANNPTATKALEYKIQSLLLQPKGKVVSIIKQSRRSIQVGNLVLNDRISKSCGPLPKSEQYIIFRPFDIRYPHFKVNRTDLPEAFLRNPWQQIHYIYSAGIVSFWPVNAKMGYVGNIQSLGEIGSIEAETMALLKENEIEDVPFTEDMLRPLYEMLKKNVSISSNASTDMISKNFESLDININNSLNQIADKADNNSNTNRRNRNRNNNKNDKSLSVGSASKSTQNKQNNTSSSSTTSSVPSESSLYSSWQIPDDEIARRVDLRSNSNSSNIRIFTIDPYSARDLDDAVHIQGPHDDGTYTIGVHIADVSYFLTQGSLLDEEARKRATSVYLVQKVIPMLPTILCEKLCSLNPNQDRLAFSCLFRISADGVVILNDNYNNNGDDDNNNNEYEDQYEPWFGRTVIRSCAKLDYDTAQRMIDGKIPSTLTESLQSQPLTEEVCESSRRPISCNDSNNINSASATTAAGATTTTTTSTNSDHNDTTDALNTPSPPPPPTTASSASSSPFSSPSSPSSVVIQPWEIAHDVKLLHQIAAARRKHRLANGSLVLNNDKLCFTLDKITGQPNDMKVYEIKESNQLIEEFMLIANQLAARKMLMSTSATNNSAADVNVSVSAERNSSMNTGVSNERIAMSQTSSSQPQQQQQPQSQSSSFLRMHAPPDASSFSGVLALTDYCQLKLDITSSLALQQSLNQIRTGADTSGDGNSGNDNGSNTGNVGNTNTTDNTDNSDGANNNKSNSNDITHYSSEERAVIMKAITCLLRQPMKQAQYVVVTNQPHKNKNNSTINSSNSNNNNNTCNYRSSSDNTAVSPSSSSSSSSSSSPSSSSSSSSSSPYLKLSKHHHYALNFDCYTHFTSPIRRYADIQVHRLLTRIIEQEVQQSPELYYKQLSSFLQQPTTSPTTSSITAVDHSNNINNKNISLSQSLPKNNTTTVSSPSASLSYQEMKSIALHCNDRQKAAKTAQLRSDEVFLTLYLLNKQNKQQKIRQSTNSNTSKPATSAATSMMNTISGSGSGSSVIEQSAGTTTSSSSSLSATNKEMIQDSVIEEDRIINDEEAEEEDAVVIGIGEKSFKILTLHHGIEPRLFVEDIIRLNTMSSSSSNNSRSINSADDSDAITTTMATTTTSEYDGEKKEISFIVTTTTTTNSQSNIGDTISTSTQVVIRKIHLMSRLKVHLYASVVPQSLIKVKVGLYL